MKFKMAVAAVAFAALPGVVLAQDYASTNDTIIWSNPRPDGAVNTVSVRELDALLAPVALYPDQLLSQILMAATYPLEVVEAARWMERPENKFLNGERLAAALDAYDWDPSVKALAAFPEVLAMLNQDLDWMNRMGDAFIDSEGAVMDSVQRLRREARAAGKLLSDGRQRVVVENNIIVIEPATMEAVYVPVYDTRVAYGIWPYADFPPVYFPPPPRYIYSPWISYSFVSVRPFWGWSRWDWGGRRIQITDIPRWRQNNRGRWTADNDVWRHDPAHRRGVGRGDRFHGPINNDRNGIAINRPEPDRFARDPNRGPGAEPGRSGPGMLGNIQAHVGQGSRGQGDVGQGNANDGARGERDNRDRDGRFDGNRDFGNRDFGNRDRGNRNRGDGLASVPGGRRSDVQLPNATPPLPDASPALPAVRPVPGGHNARGDNRRNWGQGREQADNMRGRRNDQGDGGQRGFRGQQQQAAPPLAIQPAQPPVMAQSQPGIAPVQSDRGAPRGAGWMAQSIPRASDGRSEGPRASDGRSGGEGGRRGGGNRRGGRDE